MADQETADLLDRIGALERQQRRTDPRASIETAMWAVMRNVFPEETRRHVKAAGREQLLAARSYLDHWIAKFDATAGDEPAPRETIEVE